LNVNTVIGCTAGMPLSIILYFYGSGIIYIVGNPDNVRGIVETYWVERPK
jgi:hypothetical protein